MSSSSTIALCVALLGIAGAVRADDRLRGKAREVLNAAGCNKCHDSAINAEHPKALAVYDLASARWPETIKETQLPKLLSRLRSAPAADQQIIEELIRSEQRARAAGRR